MTQDNPVGPSRRGLGKDRPVDHEPRLPPTGSSPGPMSERMQALLSKAAEEQLNEQRAVSAVLTDLRQLVTGLAEQLRGTASSTRLDSLGSDVGALVTEVRRSGAELDERLDALRRQVDEQAAATSELVAGSGSGTEALGVRVAALGAGVAAHGPALDRLTASVASLSTLPDSLTGLQREVSGLQGQLTPLEQVRSGLADLTARTGALEALRPEVAAVGERLSGLATVGALQSALAPMRVMLEELAAGAPVVERLTGMDARLDVLRERFDALDEQLAVVGEAVGAVPDVATDLARVAARVELVAQLRTDVAGLQTGVTALQEDTGLPTLALAVAALCEDVTRLDRRVSQVVVPTPGDIAAVVSQQVTDRLVEQLAPRVAEFVLTQAASTLVEQVAASVTSSVQEGLMEQVRAASADSEHRISAHVDEAILALAEALLRRRRSAASATTTSVLAGLAEAGQEGRADPELEGAVREAVAARTEPAPQQVHERAYDRVHERVHEQGQAYEPGPGEAPEPWSAAGAEELPAVRTDDQTPAADLAPTQAHRPYDTDADMPPAAAAVDDEPVDDEPVDDVTPAEFASPVATAQPSGRMDDVDEAFGEPDWPQAPSRAAGPDLDATGPLVFPADVWMSPSAGVDSEVPDSEAPGSDAPSPVTDPWPHAADGDDEAEAARSPIDESPTPRENQPGRESEPGGDNQPDGGAETAAFDPTRDPAPLVDNSPAPASAFRGFPRPAPPARPIPAVQRPAPPSPAAANAPPAAAAGEGSDEWDDEVEDGPRRRPWWRPGG